MQPHSPFDITASHGITSYLMLLGTIGLESVDGTIGLDGTTPQLPRVQFFRRTPLKLFFTNTLMVMFRIKDLCRLVFMATFVKQCVSSKELMVGSHL